MHINPLSSKDQTIWILSLAQTVTELQSFKECLPAARPVVKKTVNKYCCNVPKG